MLCCWINFLKTWSCLLWLLLPLMLPLIFFRLKRRWDRSRSGTRATIGIFHPYCNAGGGGERVLWAAVQTLQENFADFEIVIYTGDLDVSPEEIVGKVSSSLQINLKKHPRFVYLHQRKWIESSRYPFFTLLGQSLGSVILGVESVMKFTPDFFLDTMGYAFTYPLLTIVCGSRVACYTHYPVISTDMLTVVSSSTESFNNRAFIARSGILTQFKVLYYRLFAFMYGFVGRFSHLIMVNSSWTRNHIKDIWSLGDETVHLVYPPCDTSAFQSLPLTDKKTKNIISIAQFRPEKNHQMQLIAFKQFLQFTCASLSSSSSVDGDDSGSKLVLVGSCRNREDEERVQRLKDLTKELGLENEVDFKLNITFEELLLLVQEANIGIHSMKNEHFGISVVELMAGGVITIAHDSAGPKMDIIRDGVTGFLATDAEDYAEKMKYVVNMTDSSLQDMRLKARDEVSRRFSDTSFKQTLTSLLKNFLMVQQ